MIPLPLALILGGLLLLALGAECLLRGSLRLAGLAGAPLTLLASTLALLASGAPELAVGLQAASLGHDDLVVGAVFGGVLAQLALLGGCAVLRPQRAYRAQALLGAPLLLAALGLVWWLAQDAELSRGDGLLLLAALCLGLYLLALCARRQPLSLRLQRLRLRRPRRWPGALLVLCGGTLLLAAGAALLVQGADQLALALGLSQRVIALTVLAVCASAPQLLVSLLAALRGESGVAVGNVLGGSLVNLLLVLGACALLRPEGLSISPNSLPLDLPSLLLGAAALLLILLAGLRLGRCEGALLLLGYLAFHTHLLLIASGVPRLAQLQRLLPWLALPLGVLVGLLLCLRLWRGQSAFHSSQPAAESREP